MKTWNINIIGDQSLDITNGEEHIYHESDWLSGEGVWARKGDYEIPTLIDLWKEIEKVGEIEKLQYSDFGITRYKDGFVFEMKSGYKDVVSDATALGMDLLAFIDMLDEISGKEAIEGRSNSDYDKLLAINSTLDSALKETTYEN